MKRSACGETGEQDRAIIGCQLDAYLSILLPLGVMRRKRSPSARQPLQRGAAASAVCDSF